MSEGANLGGGSLQSKLCILVPRKELNFMRSYCRSLYCVVTDEIKQLIVL